MQKPFLLSQQTTVRLKTNKNVWEKIILQKFRTDAAIDTLININLQISEGLLERVKFAA